MKTCPILDSECIKKECKWWTWGPPYPTGGTPSGIMNEDNCSIVLICQFLDKIRLNTEKG